MKIKNIWALLMAVTDAILCCIILVMSIIDKSQENLFDVLLMGFFSLYFLQLAVEKRNKNG